MKRSWILAAAILTLAALPPLASAASPLAMITGGGIAVFDEPHPFPGTTFSMGVTLYEGGEASGHFTCLIGSIVVISGDVDYWSINDDGNVTFGGTANVVCPSLPHLDDPACQDVEFFNVSIESTGGAGVGHFTYQDSFMVGAGIPPDPETVVAGRIDIHTP